MADGSVGLKDILKTSARKTIRFPGPIIILGFVLVNAVVHTTQPSMGPMFNQLENTAVISSIIVSTVGIFGLATDLLLPVIDLRGVPSITLYDYVRDINLLVPIIYIMLVTLNVYLIVVTLRIFTSDKPIRPQLTRRAVPAVINTSLVMAIVLTLGMFTAALIGGVWGGFRYLTNDFLGISQNSLVLAPFAVVLAVVFLIIFTVPFFASLFALPNAAVRDQDFLAALNNARQVPVRKTLVLGGVFMIVYIPFYSVKTLVYLMINNNLWIRLLFLVASSIAIVFLLAFLSEVFKSTDPPAAETT